MKKLGLSVLVLTLAVFLAVPAMGASITPYASMRLGTYWVNHEFNDYDPRWTDDDSDSSLMIDIADISRFGAKGEVGDIYGVVEIGLVGNENTSEYTWDAWGGNNNAVYTRLLYGTWDFGGGKLTVGQDYTPVTYTSDQQGPGIFHDHEGAGVADQQSYDLQNAFIGVGCLWDSRIPQIRLNLDNGFYVLVAQNDDVPPQGAASGGDVDITLPKVVLGWDVKGEAFMLRPGLAYNSYHYEAGAFDDDIVSWIAFLHGAVDFGAVALKFTGHYGENLGDYSITGRGNIYEGVIPGTTTRFNASRAYVVGDDIENAECYGGWLQAAFKVDPATITVGAGYASQENDDAVAGFDDADELMGYFVNCKIPIAEMFTMTPEFDYWDGMDNAAGNEDPDHWALGITWQIDF